MPAAPITISGPASLVEAVPYLLGFTPADSLVLVGLRNRSLTVTARLDLDGLTDQQITDVLEVLATEGGSTTAVALTNGPAADTGPVSAAAATVGITITEHLRVHDGRYWSMTCPIEGCCPAEGTGNPNNMLSKVTSPKAGGSGTGASASLTYPTSSSGTQTDYEPTASTDTQSNKTSMTWDGNTNQLASSSTTDSGGNSVGGNHSATYQGDSHGTDCGAKTGEMCKSTSANGHDTTYGYDTNGNLTSVTPPSPLGQKTYTYDAAGRVATATDGRGNTARYRYDNDDRITRINYTSGGCAPSTCVAYGYDNDGDRTSRTDNTGTTTGWVYDPLNRITSETLTTAGSNPTTTTVAAATYDGASNMLTFTDAGGTITYKYDAANNLIRLAEPGGNCPASVTTPNSTGCTLFSYDNDNRRTDTTYPTGQVAHIDYDHAGKITAVTAKNSSGTVLVKRAYTYQSSSSGQDQNLVKEMTDEGSGDTNYTYDGKNRLKTTTGTDAGSWNYDNDGNRTSWTQGGTTTYAAYNDADQLCWTATSSGSGCSGAPTGATTVISDGNGNQNTDTTSAGALANTFNVFNEDTQTAVSGAATVSFSYPDADSTSRATASTSSNTTSYTNGILGVTGQTTTPGGATINFVRDPSGTLIAMRTSGASYYYTTDALGSVIALTDSGQTVVAKYHFTPWGANTSSSGSMAATNPWRYAGGYYDSQTGYTKMGTRYYNPVLGRFTAPDPHGTWGGYTYGDDNPVTNTDPSGNDWFDTTLSAIGTAAGAVGLGLAAAACPICDGVAATTALAVGVGSDAVKTGYDASQGNTGELAGDGISLGFDALSGGLGSAFGKGAAFGVDAIGTSYNTYSLFGG